MKKKKQIIRRIAVYEEHGYYDKKMGWIERDQKMIAVFHAPKRGRKK